MVFIGVINGVKACKASTESENKSGKLIQFTSEERPVSVVAFALVLSYGCKIVDCALGWGAEEALGLQELPALACSQPFPKIAHKQSKMCRMSPICRYKKCK